MSNPYYEGEYLERAASQFGVRRHPEESDWDLRKRVFVTMCNQSHEEADLRRALGVLMGGDYEELDSMDRGLYIEFLRELQTPGSKFSDPQTLAHGFQGDPLPDLQARKKFLAEGDPLSVYMEEMEKDWIDRGY